MRERAATDFGTNLIVLAGAGTGKTSLLVERILVAVGSGRATLHSPRPRSRRNSVPTRSMSAMIS